MVIAIIGSGIAGSYLAYKLSKSHNKKDIILIEEHDKIGYPKHCTGLVTKTINKIEKIPKNLIINELDTAILHIDDLSIKLKVRDVLLDREKLEQHFYDLAKVKKIKKSKVKEISKRENKYIISDGEKEFIADKIIGADGPNSIVKRTLFKENKLEFYSGIQAVVKGNFKSNTYEVYFDKKYSDVMFSWIVPINSKKALIGVAAQRKTKDYFNRFLTDLNIDNTKIIEKFGGTIPVFNPRNRIEKQNAYLIGDSAGQVKATTGGGIIPIMRAANLLKKSLDEDLSYETLVKKNLNKELKVHLKIHNLLKSFDERELKAFFETLNESGLFKIISKNDRDDFSKILLKLIVSGFKHPKIIKYYLKALPYFLA